MHSTNMISKVQASEKKKTVDYKREILFLEMRLLPVQASMVNPVIFVVCEMLITTATCVTGCVKAGGTITTY